MNKNKQIRGFVQKQKMLISKAPTGQAREYLVMMWLGFINGLRLTNAISWSEYRELDREISDYVRGVEAA